MMVYWVGHPAIQNMNIGNLVDLYRITQVKYIDVFIQSFMEYVL